MHDKHEPAKVGDSLLGLTQQSVSRGWGEMILLLCPALMGHSWSTGSRSGLSDMREIKRHWSRPSERAVKVIFSVCVPNEDRARLFLVVSRDRPRGVDTN